MTTIDRICGCEITAEDRRKEMEHLRAELSRLKLLEEKSPKRYNRNWRQYELWRQTFAKRLCYLEELALSDKG